MNRDDRKYSLSRARSDVEVIHALAEGEQRVPGNPTASLYLFLAEELDARFERIQVEIEAWDAPATEPEPPAMPPLSEAEVAAEGRITEGLQRAVVLLRQRNLDNAVMLARQAAEGGGPLIDRCCELGRRFDAEQA